jgi:hypothetical protein
MTQREQARGCGAGGTRSALQSGQADVGARRSGFKTSLACLPAPAVQISDPEHIAYASNVSRKRSQSCGSDQLGNLQAVLEQRTARSAQTLRALLGPITLQPVTPEIGRPFYQATTAIDALALIETPPDRDDAGAVRIAGGISPPREGG